MTSKKFFGGEIELLKVEDISQALNVSMETIRRYVRTGKLKAQKIGRRYYCLLYTSPSPRDS